MNIKKIIGMTCSALLFPYAAHADLKSNWLLGLSGGYVYQDGELHSNLDYTISYRPAFLKLTLITISIVTVLLVVSSVDIK